MDTERGNRLVQPTLAKNTMVRNAGVESRSARLTPGDLVILANVESAIRNGRELKTWWEANRDTRVRMNRFPLARQVQDSDSNYGFLLNANLSSGALRVAGVIQDQLFAWPKAPTGAKAVSGAHLRAFILRHFTRLACTHPRLRAGGEQSRTGWAYQQAYYKLEATGEIGRFPDAEQTQIVPLDEIGKKYSWVVFRVNIYHLNMPFDLMDTPHGPQINMSLLEPVYTVMTPDYLVDEDNPEPGVVGRYGYGYSVVPNPTVSTLLAAAPSGLTHTIETLTFRLLDTGEIRAHMDFIMPQAPRIMNFDPVALSFAAADKLSFGAASKIGGPLKSLLEGFELQIDPVFFSIRLLNLMTAGLASDEFGVNRNRVLKTIMTSHFTDVYAMFNLAASHFAMVSDWTDTANLPEWAKVGANNPLN